MRTLVALLLPVLMASAYADPVETLYIKNNGDCIGYVWVNNEYQGYVPAGKARYTVHEGFVTGDSGFQSDGMLKQTYSHAGWESSGDTIHVVINMEDSKGKLYATKIDITGDIEHKGYVWFGEQQSGDEPDSLVWEDSSQIQSETQPITKKKSSDADAYAATKGQGKSYPFLGTWSGPAALGGTRVIRFLPDGKIADTDEGYTRTWSCTVYKQDYEIHLDYSRENFIFRNGKLYGPVGYSSASNSLNLGDTWAFQGR